MNKMDAQLQIFCDWASIYYFPLIWVFEMFYLVVLILAINLGLSI